MDAAATGSFKWAGRRLVTASVLLATVSACYYLADEVAFTYRELDGYLPLLPIVRLSLAIVAGGLLLAIAYPVRVLAVRLPLAVRRSTGDGSKGESSRRDDTSEADDGRTRPGRRALHLERALDAALSLLALGCAYLLIDRALTPALVPLTGGELVVKAFLAVTLLAAALLGLWLVWELRGVVVSGGPRREPATSSRAAAIGALEAGSTVTCRSCGAASPVSSRFCQTCGADLRKAGP